MKSRYRLLLCGMVAAFSLISPLAAQDTTASSNDSPLLEMLALIPDTPAVRETTPTVSYIDYQALNAAWPEAGQYESWAEWNAASEAKELEAQLWVANRQRMYAGPSFWNYFAVSGETPDLVGFDLLEIDRVATFGTPPPYGVILAGDFDTDAVSAAFSAREYETTDVSGVTVLQWGDEGDGLMTDLANRNPANPFGGDIGRKEPIALIPGYILNSPVNAVLESIIQASVEEQLSLADDPSYLAAANAISAPDGLLIQALFFDPLVVGMQPLDPVSLGVGRTQEELDAIMAQLEASAAEQGPLPAYTLAVMADRQEDGEQVILVALVYPEIEGTEAAADELTRRLAAFSNELVLGSDTPLIDNIEGAAISNPRIYLDRSTGYTVSIAEARYPMPEPILYNADDEPAQEGEKGMPRSPGILFRMWVNAIYQRSFTPLAISLE